MKKKLFTLPLIAVFALTGCIFGKKPPVIKDPLVIPNVDVKNIQITLPERPTYNTGAVASDDAHDYIDLYELSDFHGAVNYEEHSDRTYLGLKKLATYLNGKRANNPGGTLVLSTGDMFQGSADSNLTRGYLVNYCMNYMGFDAMAVGNHEFDWSEEWLKNNAELTYNTSTIPFLGANILRKSDNKIPEYLTKSTIVTRGDYKIGLIGVIGSRLEASVLKSLVQDFDFVPYGDIVSEEAARLKAEEGCNAVVLLAHDQADNLETFSNIDAAFGGHAHTNYPNAAQNTTRILATENYGSAVAHIKLMFNKETNEYEGVSAYDLDRFYSSASSIKDDEGIANIMNQFDVEINKIKNIELGKCDAELEYNRALKNICTQTMFESAIKYADTVDEIDSKKIVASFTNVNGGIRDNIQPGKITYGDVYKCFPFDNEVVLIEVTGKFLKNKLANATEFGCYRIFEEKSYFVDSFHYYIVTTDFLATSPQFTSAFRVFEEEDIIHTGRIVREDVAQKIYDIDDVKNSDWTKITGNYAQIPMGF